MNKKVFPIVITSVLVMTLSLIGLSCGPSGSPQFLTYTDKVNGFSIDYPQGWDVKPKESSNVKVAIWSKRVGLNPAGILVAKYEARGYSLKRFSELQIEALPDLVKDYVPVSTEELTVNGIPAIKHTYTETVAPTSYTTVKIYLVETSRSR